VEPQLRLPLRLMATLDLLLHCLLLAKQAQQQTLFCSEALLALRLRLTTLLDRLISTVFDGTNFRTAAQITAEVDGTPGVGIVPGRIVFDTANSSGTLTEAMRITSAGDLRFNSGFGSAANAYGCRAWVNFAATGGVITVLGSGNVSSVTRNDAGDHTINFSTAMPDANYAYNVTNGSGFTGHSGVYGTSSLGIVSRAVATGTLGDAGSNHVSVFR
jgi:hypothetical protein